MEFPSRYDRNRSSLSEEQQRRLAASSVLVLGCGGVGGYVIEYLARTGVGTIYAADGDAFEPSNLNRQLLSTEANLGTSKAGAALERVREINSGVRLVPLPFRITEENAAETVRKADAVADCLDDPAAKLICARAASEAGVPFVHGAISGWCARVHTVMPGDDIMEALCGGGGGTEKFLGNLSFTASACACLEAAEIVKLLLGTGGDTRGALVEADLLTMAFERIPLS